MADKDAAWAALEAAARADAEGRIDALFQAEPDRVAALSFAACGLELDLSKQSWSQAGHAAAQSLAWAADLDGARHRLFAGEIVNASEHRPALHMALRAPDGAQFQAAGAPISGEVEATRGQMREFSQGIRGGQIRGATGKPFRAVVHIGIGGSDLGPKLVWEALKPLEPGIELRFVANIDGAEIAAALAGLDPAETVVIVVSKSFTTEETLVNGKAARAWLAAALGEDGANQHLAAVSANVDGAQKFGVAAERIFAFWDWVGGRYSLWSAVGLSCAIGLGWEVFAALLAGGAAMDEHFRTAPLEQNAPAQLALGHIFNRNGLGRPIRAVVPYARRLALLPAFLQQLEMESNGKRVDALGHPVVRGTASAVFGDAGTTGQHAFFQMLHQGTDVIPVDIIAAQAADEGPPDHQARLLANAVAQAEALMVGHANPAEPWRDFPGDRPTSFILLPRLTPESLGALIVLYEHKVFVEGTLWGIDSFDQWGVELGKTLAKEVFGELDGGAAQAHDASTTSLIARLKG